MKNLLSKYKHIFHFLFFLAAFALFLHIAGFQIIHHNGQNPLNWEMRIGKEFVFPLFFFVKGGLSILLGFWFASTIVGFCEKRIKSVKQISATNKSIVINFIQIVVYLLVFLTILDILNLQTSSITFIVGAATFGIGLGLRQIASNLVSGLVLLIEKSINVGDFVEIKDRGLGFVRHTGTLYTHIEMTDGKEIFIPNAELFNRILANWTLSNREARIEMEIPLAYNIDIEQIKKICFRVMKAHPNASQTHDCMFIVDRFSEYGMIIKLFFWIDDIFLGRGKIKSELLTSLYQEFHKIDVVIPSYVTSSTGGLAY